MDQAGKEDISVSGKMQAWDHMWLQERQGNVVQLCAQNEENVDLGDP